jgi:hypothetical protein
MTEYTGQELLEKIQTADQNGNYTEELFQEAISHVLDANGVEYISEHPLGVDDRTDTRRYCDIYIPKTDTAIELKLEATLTGVGQCVYYSRFCREALLLADGDPVTRGHNSAVRQAVEITDGVHYGLCIPGPHKRPPLLDIKTNSRSEFIFAAAHGDLGETDFAVTKQLGRPSEYNHAGPAADDPSERLG